MGLKGGKHQNLQGPYQAYPCHSSEFLVALRSLQLSDMSAFQCDTFTCYFHVRLNVVLTRHLGLLSRVQSDTPFEALCTVTQSHLLGPTLDVCIAGRWWGKLWDRHIVHSQTDHAAKSGHCSQCAMASQHIRSSYALVHAEAARAGPQLLLRLVLWLSLGSGKYSSA